MDTMPVLDALSEIVEVCDFPKESVLSVALGCLSVSLGAKLEVVGAAGHEQTRTGSNLFVILSMPSGEGKSELLRLLAYPIWKYEQGLPKIKVKQGRDEYMTSDRFCIDDATVEAIALRFGREDAQRPFVASITSEGGNMLDILQGRYRNGKADYQIFLKGYSREYFTRDRVNAPPVVITNPVISLLWCVQQDVATDISNASSDQKGFLGRCLIAKVENGKRNAPEAPRGKLAHLYEWNQKIYSLLEFFHNKETPMQSVDGSACYAEFARFHNATQRRDDLTDSIACRARENAIRVAACLHAGMHGKHSANFPLDPSTAKSAIRIVEWFLSFAGESKENRNSDVENKILNYLSRLKAAATRKQIMQFCHLLTAQASPALEEMARNGQILSETITAGNGKQVTYYRAS